MNATRYWKVSELADLAHVTVRTLHHYDEIGLLVPSARTSAGYRLYTAADLDRLYRILLHRELGLPLERIGRILDAPEAERREVLLAQRAVLLEKRRRTDAVLHALDRALEETTEGGTRMSDSEIVDGFDALMNAPAAVRAHHADHAAEVQRRWGTTDAYAESARRARDYTKSDWQKMQEETAANEAHMAELLAAGVSADSTAAMAGAERMREQIERWFYRCSYTMHAGLADMYEADPRFTAYYEKRAAGLASFVAEAIRANALRAWEAGAE